MLATDQTIELIDKGGFDKAFLQLYTDTPVHDARKRYINAIRVFEETFGARRGVMLLSVPGRTEIGGNHTDHQRGRVLAAAVDLDIVCVASPNSGGAIHISSDGYPACKIDLDDLKPDAEEPLTPASLIRGVPAWFKENGYCFGGFDAYMTSDVLVGSGLSSSAAFAVAIGCLMNVLHNDGAATPVDVAIAAQYAENVYFGKPSGLMDQIATAVGGLIQIDFRNKSSPAILPIGFDIAAAGYTLCIVDTKGSHSGLNSAYAAIPSEMQAVAAIFGKDRLGEVDEAAFLCNLAKVRATAGDRATLRAMHFFSENARVVQQTAALQDDDFGMFLRLVIESGESSLSCLQNIYSSPENQGLSIALALSKRALAKRGGAWRVHGGGFAGTIQAFVPSDLMPEYSALIDGVFGERSCLPLSIRPVGGVELLPCI